jgi:hypothetical protein
LLCWDKKDRGLVVVVPDAIKVEAMRDIRRESKKVLKVGQMLLGLLLWKEQLTNPTFGNSIFHDERNFPRPIYVFQSAWLVLLTPHCSRVVNDMEKVFESSAHMGK